jgi:zinc protease
MLSVPPLDLEEHTLDNGLRVVLNPDPTLPLVAVNLWYHVGSKNEQPGRTGFAHLFEHMLFQGSQNVGTNDHFRLVQQAGGVANGSTWYDRTNYYETLPAHWLELGLWLESDRMGYLLPAMTEAKLENQRQVVMNERRQRVDNQPYGRAFERLHELLYPGSHPYHWPVIGYMEDIEAASLDEVEAFFRTYYTPNNAVLTLAGDLAPGDALEKVERYFGPIPAGPQPPAVTAEQAVPEGGPRKVLRDTVELSRLYLAFQAPAYGQRGWYAADLLALALTGGRSSPLYRDLVYERQIAQDVSAFVLPTEVVATFGVVATARPDTSIEALEDAVWGHLEAAVAAPPPEEELYRARNRVLTSAFEGLQQLDYRADRLSQLTTYLGDPGLVGREVKLYRSLSPEELQEQAVALFRRDVSATVVVLPRNGDPA